MIDSFADVSLRASLNSLRYCVARWMIARVWPRASSAADPLIACASSTLNIIGTTAAAARLAADAMKYTFFFFHTAMRASSGGRSVAVILPSPRP